MEFHANEWVLEKKGQIDGEFIGFDNEMAFVLTDNTFYYQLDDKQHKTQSYKPVVDIYVKGHQRVLFEADIKDYALVEETTGFKSTIINDFQGWSRDAIFELQNGQVWQQDSHIYKHIYTYAPTAIIVQAADKHLMLVKGKCVRVKRIL